AAQAHGARVQVKGESHLCGGLGDVSVFSFYANKAVTCGEGGMLLARHEQVAERARARANLYFSSRRFDHEELGHNYRLSSLQAALGLAQIERLQAVLLTKRRINALYRERLAGSGFVLQSSLPWAEPIYWMNAGVLRDDAPGDAAALAELLRERGVDTRPFFSGMHQQNAFSRRGLFAGESYPVTEHLAERGLYLPSGLDLTQADIERVAGAVQESLAELRPRKAARPISSQSAALEPFSDLYATAYDSLYGDKDYAREISVVCSAFDRFATRPVKRVLDLGCGTGRHVVELVRRNYEVVGVDRSKAMLAHAAKRVSARLVHADLTELALDERFDAVLMLFAVLGYQTTLDGLRRALNTAHRHLEPGGLFMADVWYGPSVLQRPPAKRRNTWTEGGAHWTREVDAEHVVSEQRVAVTYALSRSGTNQQSHVRETHAMHYFFPFELRLLLEGAGFDVLALGNYADLERPPPADDYTATIVARAL
ncbi:MAG TPA: DegT/DnrJ/EryC1/StrS family aminotransferase, partial [Polyangiaceae bacterium]|nr:DegT/DnrJ/EryC1/StrS family aminotransferase [Polyangiaceae bacterium]